MRCTMTVLLALLGSFNAIAEQPILPAGAAPPALEFPHFPSRVHAFVWRNWHLLPYDQLLTLLDMTSPQLAQILREDDFFFIKLGLLKPTCARLVYAPPDEASI